MEEKSLMAVNSELSVTEVSNQVAKIQDLMSKVMHDGEHFGTIPGVGKDRKSLFKSGAEKLCFVFRLAPEFAVERDDLPNGHREYRVTCRLRSMASSVIVGEGLGSCSTMETKYRYRENSDYEVLDEPIPEDSKERKAEYRKQGYGMKKVNGDWCWVRYTSSERVENPDIADTYNTVLKMAKKRAHIDATITACAASDIFTQDVGDADEEPPEGDGKAPAANQGRGKPQGKAPAGKAPAGNAAPPPDKQATRGQYFNKRISDSGLSSTEDAEIIKAAVFSVVDAFAYQTVGDAIKGVDLETFGKVLDAVKAAGDKKRIDREVDAEAQQTAEEQPEAVTVGADGQAEIF